MDSDQVKQVLREQYKFSDKSIYNLTLFCDELIVYNQKYNLISRNSVHDIWDRHILDSAQLLKWISFDNNGSLSDLGTGGGFPGIILAIFNPNPSFHVKLYEKSLVKCKFLNDIIIKMKIRAKVINIDLNYAVIESNYVVCRAFKKLPEIIKISHEKIKVDHKLIILKGKNAQKEINMLSEKITSVYELKDSITDKESKIIIINVKKNLD